VTWLSAFGRFCWDFVVGDEWRIAVIVTGMVAVGAVVVETGAFSTEVLAVVMAVGLAGLAGITIVVGGRRLSG
jgi:hypothetical protein